MHSVFSVKFAIFLYSNFFSVSFFIFCRVIVSSIANFTSKMYDVSHLITLILAEGCSAKFDITL